MKFWAPSDGGDQGDCDMTDAGDLRRVAEVLRRAQRAAIEIENAPENRKRLRTFSVQEAATLLGVSAAEVRARRTSAGTPTSSRTRLHFDELAGVRGCILNRNALARREGPEPATVVFTNFKGGSAKTTSSVHFAQYLALSGRRVLLIDLDSQASATAQFGVEPSSEVGEGAGFGAWVAGWEENRPVDATALCWRTYWPAIDLVPGGAILADAEDRLGRAASSGTVGQVLYFDVLRSFIAALGGRYDIVVVDTRPDVNLLMTAGFHAATGIVVPARATMTDLSSTAEFFAHLAGYTDDFATTFGARLAPAFIRILVTAYDPADRSQEALVELLRERFGDLVLPGAFLQSRVVGTAGFGKETLYEYEPTTDRAAYNRVLASANGVNRAIADLIAANMSGRAGAEVTA